MHTGTIISNPAEKMSEHEETRPLKYHLHKSYTLVTNLILLKLS